MREGRRRAHSNELPCVTLSSAPLVSRTAPPRSSSGSTFSRLPGTLLAGRHDPSAQLLAVLVGALLAAGAAFAHVAEDYLTGDPIVRWDVSFAAWLHEHSTPTLVSLFKIVTLAGSVAVLAGIVAWTGVLLLRRRAVDDAVLLIVTALGIELVNAGLKLVFHRPRPALAYVHLDTYSFPSGHAAGAAAVYGAMAFLIARRRGRPAWLVIGAGFVLLVGTVGFSRLYLEAHYLSDVLAGLALGLTWLSACLIAYVCYGNRSGSAPRTRSNS